MIVHTEFHFESPLESESTYICKISFVGLAGGGEEGGVSEERVGGG